MEEMIIDPDKCRKGYECVKICPVDAIEICGDLPCRIHVEDCLECRCCQDVCAAGALTWREVN